MIQLNLKQKHKLIKIYLIFQMASFIINRVILILFVNFSLHKLKMKYQQKQKGNTKKT